MRKALESRDELRRLYPPRTESAMPPERLDKFKGFIAQYKYNDIRTLFDFYPGGEIELLTRRREPIKEYRLTPEMRESLRTLELNAQGFHVLDGGVLRHLKIGRESPVVLWDVLVYSGQYLVGTTYRRRYELLEKICGFPDVPERITGNEIGLEIRGRLWLAPCFRTHLRDYYRKAEGADYLEGLMLKDPEGKLELGYREMNNSRWQIKFRKPRKDYRF